MNFFTKSLSFLFTIIILICTSCATNTAITSTKDIQEYQMQSTDSDKIQMEFIGYKADTNLLSTANATYKSKSNPRNTYTIMSPFDQWKAIEETSSLRRIGSILQEKNIATDQSYAYFGIYSLQELELYKSRTRYITFIEVSKNKYTINEKGLDNQTNRLLGCLYLGLGLSCNTLGFVYKNNEYLEDWAIPYQILGAGCDIGGLILLFLSSKNSETTIKFDGAYNIYVYDTEIKEIIYKDTVTINSNDTFTGSYLLFDESKDVISNYYGKLICNEILKKYDSINQWLKTR